MSLQSSGELACHSSRSFPRKPKGHRSPSEDLDSLARLFHILSLLRERRGQKVRRQDIAEVVGGAERNLQRYLNILKAEGLVRHDRKQGTYILEDMGVHFPAPVFTAGETLALGLAHALLGGSAIPEGERIRAALAKATSAGTETFAPRMRG